MILTDEQRDLLRDVLQAKREDLNRAAEGLLEDVERIDKLLVQLDGELPSLCPNCGEPGWHESPEACGSAEPLEASRGH
jgi:hypothetical protein